MAPLSWYVVFALQEKWQLTRKQVVPRASAVVPGQNGEPIVIHADHRKMVKYMSREDNGYNVISEHLQIMASDAPKEIWRRCEAGRRSDEGRQP